MTRSAFSLILAITTAGIGLSAPGQIRAQTSQPAIFKCVGGNGSTIYQNVPCNPGQRTASVRSYDSKPEDPALSARSIAIQQEMDRRNRPSGRSSGAHTVSSRGPARQTPCQAAKAKREATLKRVGLKRTFALLSQLDSEVWEVCKGF